MPDITDEELLEVLALADPQERRVALVRLIEGRLARALDTRYYLYGIPGDRHRFDTISQQFNSGTKDAQ